jgi:hypothetical protein
VYMVPDHGQGNHAGPPRNRGYVPRHPTISINTFSQDLVRTRNSFECSHIAETFTITAAAANPQNKLNQLQIQTLTSPIPDCHDDPRFSKQLVVAWFDIFNSLVFGGGLRDLRDRINMERGFDQRDAEDPFLYGQFSDGGHADSPGRLYVNRELVVRRGQRREEQWVKTLCHEMTHVSVVFSEKIFP